LVHSPHTCSLVIFFGRPQNAHVLRGADIRTDKAFETSCEKSKTLLQNVIASEQIS
jgi:hypothetical protein